MADRQATTSRRGHPPANGTINRELSILGTMLRLAVRRKKGLQVPTIELLKEAAPHAGFFEAHRYEAVRRRLRPDLLFAEQVVRDDQEVSEACWGELHEHFSEAEAVELLFIVGYQTFASKFAKAFALVPQGLAPQAFVPRPDAAPVEATARA